MNPPDRALPTLRECPFCGDAPHTCQGDDGEGPTNETWVYCPNRTCPARHAHEITPEKWNTRPSFAPESGSRAIDEAHLQRQRDWSEKTFGPGMRTAGCVDHIRKELLEIEADPSDLKEWVDVIILGFDAAWRTGATPAEILAAIIAKQTKNENRVWPDWRTAPQDKAIEHDRSGDAAIPLVEVETVLDGLTKYDCEDTSGGECEAFQMVPKPNGDYFDIAEVREALDGFTLIRKNANV